MHVELIGYRPYDFTNDSGERIVGTSLYYAFTEKGVIGRVAEKASVPTEIGLPSGITPGDTLALGFNHKGKIVSVEKAQPQSRPQAPSTQPQAQSPIQTPSIAKT